MMKNIDPKMVEGIMKIKDPPITNQVLIPDVLFVPCLAFDNYGFRLGYGGGYYDKTFSKLKEFPLSNLLFILNCCILS